jgi:hypothetical protein
LVDSFNAIMEEARAMETGSRATSKSPAFRCGTPLVKDDSYLAAHPFRNQPRKPQTGPTWVGLLLAVGAFFGIYTWFVIPSADFDPFTHSSTPEILVFLVVASTAASGCAYWACKIGLDIWIAQGWSFLGLSTALFFFWLYAWLIDLIRQLIA